MLRMTPRKLAVATLCASAGLWASDVSAQLAPTPAPPRQDTPRNQDEAPQRDSRAGGSLSREAPEGTAPEVDPADGADVEQMPDREGVRPAREPGASSLRTSDGDLVQGKVLSTAANSIAVEARGPGQNAAASKTTFQVPDSVEITRNGEEAQLSDIENGDNVRLETSPGDRSIVTRIVATTELTGSVNEIRSTSGNDNRPRGRVRQGQEEAVLPLGIELYTINSVGLVTEMLADGPADRGGLQVGDLVVSINGEPLDQPETIEQNIARRGGTAELLVQRDGQEVAITIEPGAVVEGSLVRPVAIREALTAFGAIVLPGGQADRLEDRDADQIDRRVDGAVRREMRNRDTDPLVPREERPSSENRRRGAERGLDAEARDTAPEPDSELGVPSAPGETAPAPGDAGIENDPPAE